MNTENENNSIFRLVNPNFKFEFMGEVYNIRKATLDKAVQYQVRVKELSDSKDFAADAKIVAFCIKIMLEDSIKDLTEEKVLKNIPANIDTLKVLTSLGFMSPTTLNQAKKVQENLRKSIGEKSL